MRALEQARARRRRPHGVWERTRLVRDRGVLVLVVRFVDMVSHLRG